MPTVMVALVVVPVTYGIELVVVTIKAILPNLQHGTTKESTSVSLMDISSG